MSNIRLANLLDKFDACMPNKRDFIHDQWEVSARGVHFHGNYSYSYNTHNHAQDHSYGIQRKVYHASGLGIQVDGISIGLSNT